MARRPRGLRRPSVRLHRLPRHPALRSRLLTGNALAGTAVTPARERRRSSGTYLLRGTKFLSYPDGTTEDPTGFTAFVATAPALEARLAAVPVAYVLVDTSPASHSYPHHELLRATLSADTQLWQSIYRARRTALGIPHEIEIYRYRKDVTRVPVHFDVDLSRKIRQSIEVGN